MSHQRPNDSAARSSLRRSLGLTALATLLPGAGLTFTRLRRLGVALLLAFVGLATWGLVHLARQGVITSAADLLTGQSMVTVMVGLAVAALVWVASIILTATVSRPSAPSRPRRALHVAFTALMCLVVIVPLARAAQYADITKDTVSQLLTRSYERPGDGPVATPSGGPQDPWRGTSRVNVLLLGSDAGPDRAGVRTDSMIVDSIDTKNGNSVLISIPRNLEGMPIPRNNPLSRLYPDGYRGPNCARDQCLMNSVWTDAGVEHRDLFPRSEPNPGLDTTREVIQDVLGLHIDHTVVIDLHGFQQLVDAMGGVRIDVKVPPPGLAIGGQEVPDGTGGYVVKPGSITGYLKPGVHRLNGYQALWYARSRVQSSDYNRMSRQRCMVNALVHQVDPVTMLTRFPQIMAVAKDNIQIDIPRHELSAWVVLVKRMKSGRTSTLALDPPRVNPSDPDYARIRALVRKAVRATTRTSHHHASPHPVKTRSATGHSATKAARNTSGPGAC